MLKSCFSTDNVEEYNMKMLYCGLSNGSIVQLQGLSGDFHDALVSCRQILCCVLFPNIVNTCICNLIDFIGVHTWSGNKA